MKRMPSRTHSPKHSPETLLPDFFRRPSSCVFFFFNLVIIVVLDFGTKKKRCTFERHLDLREFGFVRVRHQTRLFHTNFLLANKTYFHLPMHNQRYKFKKIILTYEYFRFYVCRAFKSLTYANKEKLKLDCRMEKILLECRQILNRDFQM